MGQDKFSCETPAKWHILKNHPSGSNNPRASVYTFSVHYCEVDILSLRYAPAEELTVQGGVYQPKWILQSKDSARGQFSSEKVLSSVWT